MIRPFLTEILLFLAPFAIYALFLAATRAGVFTMSSWSATVLAWLTAIALVLVIISFFFWAQFFGEPAGSEYIAPHMENGKLIPGYFK